jgi:hypothetical protein
MRAQARRLGARRAGARLGRLRQRRTKVNERDCHAFLVEDHVFRLRPHGFVSGRKATAAAETSASTRKLASAFRVSSAPSTAARISRVSNAPSATEQSASGRVWAAVP